MIRIRKAENESDIRGILALQRQHLRTSENLSKDWSDGFVTLQHTEEILRQMMAESPQMIALYDGAVVGYNLSMVPHRSDTFPILKPMMEAFENINIDGKKLTEHSYVIGGQCCIDEKHRGKGLLKKLYEGVKDEFPCDFCVTEIASTNVRSLNAHLKIGFEKVHQYPGEDHDWEIVMWDWRFS